MTNALGTDDSMAPVERAQLHLALASVSYIGGDPATARAEAEAVLAQTGLPAVLYAAAELDRLVAVLAEGDIERPMELRLGEYRDRCNRGPDCEALVARAALLWRRGHVGETLELLWAARSAGVAGLGAHEQPALGLSTVLTAVGQFEEAQDCLLIAGDEITLSGNSLWAAAPALFAARVHLAAGRLDEATTAARSGLDIVDKLGTWVLAPIGRDVLLAASLMRGELGDATAQLDLWQTDPVLGGVPFGSPHRYWASIRVREAQGACLLGDSTTEATFDLAASDPRLLLNEPAAGAWLVRVAQRAGDNERCEQVMQAMQQLAASNPGIPSVIAAASHARGLADRDLACLSIAATEHRSLWARASAAEDAAKLSAQEGDRGTAKVWYEQANADYLRCGATRDGARIRSRLRAMGVRRHHWSLQQRPLWGWDSLTDTERTVAKLVAEGLSNRQVASRMFLSRNTVDFHLRHIFRKLDINSRVVLTRLMLVCEPVSL